MAKKKKAATKRSGTSKAPARRSAGGSVQKFLDQTGRSENDRPTFADLLALEGYGASDTASPAGDGTDGAGASAETPTS